jgi:hypothetical protein
MVSEIGITGSRSREPIKLSDAAQLHLGKLDDARTLLRSRIESYRAGLQAWPTQWPEDAIERERVELDVQPQRGVAPLHEGDRTDLRVVDRAAAPSSSLARCRSERRSAPMNAASTSAQSRRS